LRRALHHAEAMLLVHDGEPEARQRHALLDQRVRADDDLRRGVVRERRQHLAPLLRARRAGQRQQP
jgi:hypothetical protein